MENYVLGCYSLENFRLRGPDMFKQRIILINGSRLLRELLHIVIRKAEHLEIVQEIHDLDDLPAMIANTEADWVIMSLPSGERTPDWVSTYIAAHPSVRLLEVSNDASKIKMKWSEPHEEDLHDLSLNDLIHILERAPQREQVWSPMESG